MQKRELSQQKSSVIFLIDFSAVCFFFFLAAKQSPPAGDQKDCRFKVVQTGFYFSIFHIQSVVKVLKSEKEDNAGKKNNNPKHPFQRFFLFCFTSQKNKSECQPYDEYHSYFQAPAGMCNSKCDYFNILSGKRSVILIDWKAFTEVFLHSG